MSTIPHFKSILEAAKWYLENGHCPVPVPYREKGPALAEWPKLRLKLVDLMHYFNGQPSNIGLILGVGGDADVDLDCPEALAAWPEFAPARTLTWGRPSSPASHYLYRTGPALRLTKYLDEKTTLLELRGLKTNGDVGLQSIAPTSTHKETGEPIAFEPDSLDQATTVDGAKLSRAVARAASAVLIARHFPPEKAGRNHAFLALAGIFATEQWPAEDALHFARAVYRILWPSNPDFGAAGREVEATYKRFRSDAGIIGMARLRTLIDPKVVSKFAVWLKLSPRRNPSVKVNLDGLEPSIELLNSLAIWDRQIQFRGVTRRGSLLIAETTDGVEIAFTIVARDLARGIEKHQDSIEEELRKALEEQLRELLKNGKRRPGKENS
jgi:hypothetical protein